MNDSGGQATDETPQSVSVLGYQSYTGMLPSPTDGYHTIPYVRKFPGWLVCWNFFAAILPAVATWALPPFVIAIIIIALIFLAQVPMTFVTLVYAVRCRGNRLGKWIAIFCCVAWWGFFLIRLATSQNQFCC